MLEPLLWRFAGAWRTAGTGDLGEESEDSLGDELTAVDAVENVREISSVSTSLGRSEPERERTLICSLTLSTKPLRPLVDETDVVRLEDESDAVA